MCLHQLSEAIYYNNIYIYYVLICTHWHSLNDPSMICINPTVFYKAIYYILSETQFFCLKRSSRNWGSGRVSRTHVWPKAGMQGFRPFPPAVCLQLFSQRTTLISSLILHVLHSFSYFLLFFFIPSISIILHSFKYIYFFFCRHNCVPSLSFSLLENFWDYANNRRGPDNDDSLQDWITSPQLLELHPSPERANVHVCTSAHTHDWTPVGTHDYCVKRGHRKCWICSLVSNYWDVNSRNYAVIPKE